jgi:hypothetical protein
LLEYATVAMTAPTSNKKKYQLAIRSKAMINTG